MADYDNSNRGVLFKNERKEPGDKKPDYTGSIDVNGVDHFLDGWIRKSQAGKTFLSISIKRKDSQQKPASKQSTPQASSGFADMNDDLIPF